MDGPPDMLHAQRARRGGKVPAALAGVEPGADERGMAAVVAHHAAHGDLPDARRGRVAGTTGGGGGSSGVAPARDGPCGR